MQYKSLQRRKRDGNLGEKMMKALLAMDRSQCSMRAMKDAIRIYGSCLEALHVVHAHESLLESASPDIENAQTAYEFINSIAQELQLTLPNCNVTSNVMVGDPGKSIVQTAKELNVDIIFMGTHGRSGLSRMIIGSVSKWVMVHARCPVFLGSRHTDICAEDGTFKVLVATDDSEESDFALCRMLTMEWPSKVSFHLVTAMPTNNHDVGNEIDARSWLKCCEVRLTVGIKNSSVSSEILSGHPEEVVISKANDWSASMIVLGSRLPGTLERLVHGSTADSIATGATCSILVIPLQKAVTIVVNQR